MGTRDSCSILDDLIFFFSSRRRHTRSLRDWSSTCALPISTENTNVNYSEWRSRLADALLVGSVNTRPDGRFEVRFRLHDVVKQTPLGGIAYTLNKDQARATAHRISDFVYEKLTGDKGVFSTRIAYVVNRGNRYELQF